MSTGQREKGSKDMKKLRLGVVGVGHLGSLHAQKYAALKNIDLAGVADIDFEKAKRVARTYSTKAFRSHKELLPYVDGLSLAVPTVSHFEIGHDIVNHGVHLLVEKPITLTLGDAATLIEAARRNKTILQTGHLERFNPVVTKMESLISEPVFIDSARLNSFTGRGTDVDVVLDLMIHDLDIILHLVKSEIKEIEAIGMPLLTGKVDVANVRILFVSGVVANITASRVSHESVRVTRIMQPDNLISVDYNKRKIGVTHFPGAGKQMTDRSPLVYEEDVFTESDPLGDQIKSFVGSIIDGREPQVSGVDGKRALAVALSIVDQIKHKLHTST
jgi:predicted dehydrogenase